MKSTVDVDALMRVVQARLSVREGIVQPGPGLAPDTGARFFELKRRDAFHQHQYAAFGRELGGKRPGFIGGVEFLMKRLLRKLLNWYARPQVEFNASVMRALGECLRHLESMAAEIETLKHRNQESGVRSQGSEFVKQMSHPSANDPGGVEDISRWLSAAIPPDHRQLPRTPSTPEGCQRER